MDNEVADFIELYRDSPISFIENCLGADLDPWQREFFEVIPDTRKVSIAAGHGVGNPLHYASSAFTPYFSTFPAKGS